jgi:regulator of RNase E activity RraA
VVPTNNPLAGWQDAGNRGRASRQACTLTHTHACPCFSPRGPPLTVDLFEHAKHVLQVAVIQKPNGGILVIFLERHCRVKSAAIAKYQ